jgi:hypothetical protein
MEQLKFFLKYSQTLSGLGIILIMFAVMDIMGAKILTLNIKLAPAAFLLGIYHILRPIVQFIEPDN